MSRSYKKTPYSGDRKNKYMKHYANKRVRRMLKNPEENLKYKSYRKVFDSYDICDYYFLEPNFELFYLAQITNWYSWRYQYEKFPDRNECYKYWIKRYRNK